MLTTLNSVLQSDSGFSLHFGYKVDIETDPNSNYVRINNYSDLLKNVDLNFEFEQVKQRLENDDVLASSDVRLVEIVNYCYLVSIFLGDKTKINRSWELNRLLHVKLSNVKEEDKGEQNNKPSTSTSQITIKNWKNFNRSSKKRKYTFH